MSLILRGALLDDRYRVGPIIGSGGFGIVYRAFDVVAHTEVALKTLRTDAASLPDLVPRFRREAEVCARLRHPNTARLLHSGELVFGELTTPVPYLVFELVRGLPLGAILDTRQCLTLVETAAVLEHVLGSLDEAHASGVLHRDIKVNNVMVVAPRATWRVPNGLQGLPGRLGVPPPGDEVWEDVSSLEVKVLDFGLAKLLSPPEGPALTSPGVAAGTAETMSPEQARGLADIDPRSDLYGVGMLMYRMLVGRPAYDGASHVEVAAKHIAEPLPSLPEPWGHHPVSDLYGRACAKDRADRYESAASMARALRVLADPSRLVLESDPEPRRAGLLARLFHSVGAG